MNHLFVTSEKQDQINLVDVTIVLKLLTKILRAPRQDDEKEK